MRILEALQHLELDKFDPNVLCVGSHPGSDVNAIRLKFPKAKFKVVSACPKQDPDFMYKLRSHANTVLKKGNYPDKNFDNEQFDLIVVDATAGEWLDGSPDTYSDTATHWKLLKPILKHINRRHPNAALIFRVNGIELDVNVHNIFEIITRWENWGIFRPHCLHAHNNDFMCYKSGKATTYGMRHGLFKRMVNYLNNNIVKERIKAAMCLDNLLRTPTRFVNPKRDDETH